MQFSNTTSFADPDDPVLPPAREMAAFLVRALPFVALGLLLALSLPGASATRMQTWPWAAIAAAFWLLPVIVAATRLALGRSDARLGGLLDAALAALALAGLAATLLSPLRPAIAPHLLPFLGALALPYALLPLARSPRLPAWVSAFLWPLLLVTAIRWLPSVHSWSGPFPRNAEPFGHANITGSVCVLAAGVFAWLAASAPRLTLRLVHAAGALLSTVLALTTFGRGAVLALAAGGVVAAALILLRRGRLFTFALLALAALAAAFLANDRLREAVSTGRWSTADTESNAQRIAMIRGGFLLGAERPLLGWGPGSVPHVFPRVRAGLPGQPDNYLQLHNTPAQLAATLGLAGLLAAAALTLALLLRLRAALRDPDRNRDTPALAGTLAAAATLLLFDHSFAVPAFAVLAALPLAALASRTSPPVGIRRTSLAITTAAMITTATAIIAAVVARDLAARAAWSSALDAGSAGDTSAYAAQLRRAHALAPASPALADQLASHLATGHPFPGLPAPDPAGAAAILRAALVRNPDLESARYNLGWLLLDTEPESARAHLAAAARLAPARAGVHLGHAIACIHLKDTDSALRSLAAETLLDPAFAWSPAWRDPALAALRAPALAHAADFLDSLRLAPDLAALLRSPGEARYIASAHRRLRIGHGVLFGHPNGPPPADVPLFLRPALTPELRAAIPPRDLLTPARLLECARL